MKFLSRLLGRKEDETNTSGFRVIDGKVVFADDLDPVDELREFGALVFVGVNEGEPSFVPAEIESHSNLIFHQLRADRFVNGVWQKDEVPAVATDELFNSDFPDGTDEIAQAPGSDAVPEPPPASPNLPAKFPESFLVEGLTSDLGGFIDHLRRSGKTKQTVSAYALDLRHWQKALSGFLTAEKVKEVLQCCPSASRRNRMSSVLKTYGKYRLLYGDHRVSLLLSTSPDIGRVREVRKPKKVLAPELTDTYMLTAENLCRAGDRVGIWMALSLYGFRPSEFPRIRLMEKAGRRKDVISVKRKGHEQPYALHIPGWLSRAMKGIPRKKWGAQRSTIYTRLKTYGTSPRELYNAVNAVADNGAVSGSGSGTGDKDYPRAAAGRH